MTMTILLDEETDILFSMYVTQNGNYLAIRDKEPMFALSGSSMEDVVDKVQGAFTFYNKSKFENKS